MALYIICFEDFKVALSEVDIILSYAKRNQRHRERHSIFTKTAVILLVSKFEAFLEDSIKDYVRALENLGLKPEELPDILKLNCLDKLVSERFVSDVRKQRSRVFKTIERMIKTCYGEEEIALIDIDTSFDYGKHGEAAIKKLFSRIGIEDIFQSCQVFEAHETLARTAPLSLPINVAADINALTNIRNRILHGDATPSLTHRQVDDYRRHIIEFSSKIVDKLETEIDKF